jgi:spermidine/putrescine transport system substrate-binding protein
MRGRITRRDVLTASVASALAGAGVRPRAARAAGHVTVLNWQGYGTDEKWAVEAFTKQTGIGVTHDYFSSEPEMFTKLRTNPGAYDVVLINSARVQQVQADGLLTPIDLASVPNAAGLSPKLRDNPNFRVDGKPYGVAWVWGIDSLAVRKDKVPTPGSLAVLLDAKYAGRVAMPDDAMVMVGVGALLTGQDINDPKDLPAVRDKLRAMKQNIKLLWSSEDQWNKAFTADEFDVSVFWSGGAIRSIRRYHLPVDFSVPREGAIGWLDSLTVPATSTQKPAALEFINYMIDPGFYTQWVARAGAPASAYASAMGLLPEGDMNRVIYKPEYLQQLQFQAPIPDDRRGKFADLWEETKAFYAQ